MTKTRSLIGFLCLIFSISSYSQTPAVLSVPIAYDSDPTKLGNQREYEDVLYVQAAFNNARRWEELQFCLIPNSITDLNMPSQVHWDAMNSDERFLYLINAERVSRAGLNYCFGEGPVAGLPFTGVELNIDNIAQEHAELLIATQGTSSSSQAANIDANPNIGGSGCDEVKYTRPDCCHTFVPYSVYRVYFTGMDTPENPTTITTPGLEARSVYFCVYGNGSVGNGRKMLLTQNLEPGGSTQYPCGFYDDYGDTGDEGFLGIGIAGGVPHPSFERTHIDMVVLSYFDPVHQSIDCNYTCTTCETCSSHVVQQADPIQSGIYQASDSISSSAIVLSSHDVTLKARLSINLSQSFEVQGGANFQAYIEACYFSLTSEAHLLLDDN